MNDPAPLVSKPHAPTAAGLSRPRQNLLRRLAAVLKSALAEPEANAVGAARRPNSDDGVFQPRKY